MSRKHRFRQQGEGSPAEDVENEKTPHVIALSLFHSPDGWATLRYHIKGARVIRVEASKPDLKSIATENFRRDVAAMLLGQLEPEISDD